LDPRRGTEGEVQRGSVVSATILRQALERMAAGQSVVPLAELRRHLSRVERNLGRMRLRGGRYRALQISPHITALHDLVRARRKAG
jgi:hypothetical protein